MTDREKLLRLIDEVAEGMLIQRCGELVCTVNSDDIASHLLAHGVTVKEPQKPIEMVELQEDSVCWYEEKYEEKLYPIQLEEGHVNFFVSFIGIDFAERHEKCNYGKTWRCWAEKPTVEEREAAEWES